MRTGRTLLFSAVASAGMAGCVGSRLHLHDHGVEMPTLRIEHVLAAPGSGDAPSQSGRIGLEITRADSALSGDGGRYDAVSAQGYLFVPFPDLERLHTGGMFGLEVLDIDVTDRVAANGTGDGAGLGAMVGLDAGYEFVAGLEAYGRGTAAAMLPPSTSVRGELGLRYRPAAAFEMFAGYRWWHMHRRDFELVGVGSELDLDTDGLVIGVALSF